MKPLLVAIVAAAASAAVTAKEARPMTRLDGQIYPHRRWDAAVAAGSLDTTAADYAASLAAVVRGEGLSANSKAELIRRQIEPIQLGYGLGWGAFETPYGHAFFKEGNDEGTANYVPCVQPKQACIMMLSNDVRADWEGFADAL